MKRTALWLLLPLLIGGSVVFLTLSQTARAEGDDARLGQVLKDLDGERRLLDEKKRKLEELENSLKIFQTELDQKNTAYLANMNKLKQMEESLNKQVADKMIDKKILETYEAIDPEQAAVLMFNLFKKDPAMTASLMRRITPKRAGKILEAMIPIDAETSSVLAKQVIEAVKPPTTQG